LLAHCFYLSDDFNFSCVSLVLFFFFFAAAWLDQPGVCGRISRAGISPPETPPLVFNVRSRKAPGSEATARLYESPALAIGLIPRNL